ncbi:MAG: DsbA family protein, partial [Burkholderiales bacterium]|nr:DsbA family protein [Burkholderiales bacterium]
RREYGEAVDIEWRAFELRPEPHPTLDPDGEYLHRVWNQSVYPMAQQRGMVLKLPPVQPRSRKAFELAEFARERGRYDETHRALFKAFFEHGRDLSDVDVLLEIAAGVGLDTDGVRAALDQSRYVERVLAAQREAHRLGIGGVPAILIGGADLPLSEAENLSGAQPYEIVRGSGSARGRIGKTNNSPGSFGASLSCAQQ